MDRPLSELNDDELQEELRRQTKRVDWNYDVVVREVDRRANAQQSTHLTRTAYIATGAAIVSAIAALAAIVLSRS